MVNCTSLTVSAPATNVNVVESTFRCVAGCTPDEDICGTVPYEKVKDDNVWFRVRIRVSGGFINTTKVTVNYTANGVPRSVSVNATSLNIGDWDVYLEDTGAKYQGNTTYNITSVTAVKI